jgi:hypothetical protein
MILNMTEDLNFVKEELLTEEEWQQPEAEDKSKKAVQRENEDEKGESATTSSSESYGKFSLKKPHVSTLVPFHVKMKPLTLAQLHLSWSVKTISSKT